MVLNKCTTSRLQKSKSNNNYNEKNRTLDSLVVSRMAVVYMQLFLVLNLKARLKCNVGKSSKMKKKILEDKGFTSFFCVDKEDTVSRALTKT